MRGWIKKAIGATLVASAIGLGAVGIADNKVPVVETGDCLAINDCFPKPQGSSLAGVTGIPVGTSLTTCASGDAELTTPNQTYTGCTFNGSVDIHANNVTIRNSRIVGRIRTDTDVGSDPNYHFEVYNSDIGASSGCTSYEALIGVQNYVAVGNYLHNNGDAFRLAYDGNITLRDNFASLCSIPGDHSDGIQGVASGLNVTIDHNTLDQRPAGGTDVTAPIFIADNSSSCICTNNLLIANNPTASALRIHDDHTPDIGPWVITGNRLSGGAVTTNTNCATTTWTDNRAVTFNSDYTIASTGSTVPC